MTTPNQPSSRQDLEKLQQDLWLLQPITQKFIQSLQQLHLNQLRLSSRVAANPAVNDLTLRLYLTKASVLETIIERIQTGNLIVKESDLI